VLSLRDLFQAVFNMKKRQDAEASISSHSGDAGAVVNAEASGAMSDSTEIQSTQVSVHQQQSSIIFIIVINLLLTCYMFILMSNTHCTETTR